MTSSEASPSFRLAYVPGVTPTKWVRIWNERLPDVPLTLIPVPAAEACAVLRDGGADAGFLRLPVDRTDLAAIPLYTETTVVVVPKDHLVTAVDEVASEDLADEIVLHPLDETLEWERRPGLPAKERPATTADAIELVAAGVGLLVVPQSLARLHHRKDLTYRPVSDAPASRVALSWPQEETTDLVEDFIGIVRGRTVNSTRGRSQAPAPAPAQPKGKRSETGGTRRKPAGGKPGGKTAGKPVGKSGGKSPRSGSGGSGGPKGGRRGKPRRRP
ncbi:LysR family substrate-binding domain-containing protein [Streptomyces lydicamycinicus]|uniref:LysR family substrate-binding domain-containing protein n=1 Tax=Streptomyces lydicamycinicus TaxID=1546107 RepID=UPI0020353209|nr:LysR family substrate-binding domain-containing protein [Streptomyces lydicamycinicus]USA04868.1 LysR family substrate-binding domain-containing protein [Streptomyces lydicamycinicus]